MGNKVALQYQDFRLTYDDLDTYVNAIAEYYAIAYGDKIIVSLVDPLEALLTIFAGIYRGCEVLLLTPKARKNTLETVSNLYGSWRYITNSQATVLPCYKMIEPAQKNSAHDFTSFRHHDMQRTALHFQTSGTTEGMCKFVRLEFSKCLKKWKSLEHYIRISPDDVALSVTSVYFIQTLWSILLHLRRRATVLFEDLSSSIDQKYLTRNCITTLTAPPAVIKGILDRITAYPLRLLISGGDHLDRSVIKEIGVKLPGVLLSNVYGCTETAAGDILLPPIPVANENPHIHSIGQANFCSEVKVVNEQSELCDIEEVGEVFIRNDYMISCYYGTDATILKDGFFPTKDLAYVDDAGYVFYVGRAKNVIVSNGIKIHPLEVEVCIMSSGLVKECLVAGERDTLRGEIVTAHVVTCDSEMRDLELIEFLSERLESYKVPRKIYRYTELNKTVTGKIARARI
jgi:long-chain acyl-CoA synthetase